MADELDNLTLLGITPGGYTVWKQKTEAGGVEYITDEIAGGLKIYDTTVVREECFLLVAKDVLGLNHLTQEQFNQIINKLKAQHG